MVLILMMNGILINLAIVVVVVCRGGYLQAMRLLDERDLNDCRLIAFNAEILSCSELLCLLKGLNLLFQLMLLWLR